MLVALFYLSLELLLLVVKFVGYTEKSIEELAAGYSPKTGQKIVHCPPEVAEALLRSHRQQP